MAQHISKAVVTCNPARPHNEYSKTKTKTVFGSLNPVFDQFFEMHLEGGGIDKQGDYQNPHAPFTKFRLTMWDHDTLSRDDFMGEVSIPLAALMSCRTLEGWFDLHDPQGFYQNDAHKPLTGRVFLKLKWNSEALLAGSMRPRTIKDAAVETCDAPVDACDAAVSPSDPVTKDTRDLSLFKTYMLQDSKHDAKQQRKQQSKQHATQACKPIIINTLTDLHDKPHQPTGRCTYVYHVILTNNSSPS